MTEIVQTTVSGNTVYIVDEPNNTLCIDSTNTRVGIGTNNPGYELSVVGNAHATGFVQGLNLTIQAGGGGLLTFEDASTQSTAAVTGMVSFTLAGDSGSSQTISEGDTLKVGGGTALSAVASATDTVTMNLDNTAVTPATYGDATNVAQITIDAQGRITAAADVAISGGGGGMTDWNLTGTSGTTETITDGQTVTIAQGAGITAVSSSADTVTITNTGVTSNVAGAGISVSGATGAVTVTNTGVLSLAATAATNVTLSAATGAINIDILGTSYPGVLDGTGRIDGLIDIGFGPQPIAQFGWTTFTDPLFGICYIPIYQ